MYLFTYLLVRLIMIVSKCMENFTQVIFLETILRLLPKESLH